ncbi:MAG: type II secretion system F family protein [Candidatus Omnitrophica bacterium]|nr:type II secretion system F family protein [Candidatus Omnitrophota bacterium]MBU4457749.1 type II secretion system F family protein [Candidatus Omnitrophota bacterium]
MPFFRYVARDRSGRVIDEVLENESQDGLIDTLQARGLYIVSVGPAPELKKAKKARRRYHRGVKAFDLIMFSRELATLMSSGVTLIKSLDILCKQIESQTLLRAIEQVKKDIEGGYTFQNALKKHSKIFSDFWIHLVETGEASGHLPLCLDQLAVYLEESAELKKKITSAMVYPVILICVAAAAIAIFLLKIIPIFSEIFKGFNVELPLLTRIVIGMSDVVRKYFLVVGMGIGLLVFLFKQYTSRETGRMQYDAIKLKLPVLGPVILEIATERFASGLSMLIKSGVPILHALDIAEKTSGNKVVEKELSGVKTSVRDGKGIAQTMQDSVIFSPLVVQMIGIGEEIGELGKMLEKIAAFYKERVDTFVDRLTTMFEPLVLVFMGVVVGVLVIAMFMPIFSISSAVKASG